MSRRTLLRRAKLGYDSARAVKGEAKKGYHLSQCGGSIEKLRSCATGARRTRPRCAECGKRIRGPNHATATPGRHPREMQRLAEMAAGVLPQPEKGL